VVLVTSVSEVLPEHDANEPVSSLVSSISLDVKFLHMSSAGVYMIKLDGSYLSNFGSTAIPSKNTHIQHEYLNKMHYSITNNYISHSLPPSSRRASSACKNQPRFDKTLCSSPIYALVKETNTRVSSHSVTLTKSLTMVRKQHGKKRRPRSDDPDPSWSKGRVEYDCPDDESSGMYSLDNLVESWNQKTLTVVHEDGVEMQLEETLESDDDESIPPAPVPPVADSIPQAPSEKKTCPRRYMVGGTLLALVCIAAIVAVSVVAPNKSTPSTVSSSATDGNVQTGSPYDSPPASRQEAFQRLLTGVSLEDSFKTDDSPQSKALDWIVQYDSAQLDPSSASQREVQERYILAVFYYAVGGANWFDSFYFLSQNHVCNWKNADFGMGIQCDEYTKTVNGFKFGKSPCLLISFWCDET